MYALEDSLGVVNKELTLCKLESLKWIYILVNSEDSDENVAEIKKTTYGTEVHRFWEIFTCNPLICIMKQLKLIV